MTERTEEQRQQAIAFHEEERRVAIRKLITSNAALRSLGIIYPLHLVEPEVTNVHQLRMEEPGGIA